jgi:hypothetical protein
MKERARKCGARHNRWRSESLAASPMDSAGGDRQPIQTVAGEASLGFAAPPRVLPNEELRLLVTTGVHYFRLRTDTNRAHIAPLARLRR